MSTFKIVLLGEGSVGKTSLVMRYTKDTFNTKHEVTIQAAFLQKNLTFPNGQRYSLNIWDTAGQERFRALSPLYYRDAHGALLVYDITDNSSFDRVKSWVKELKKTQSQVAIAIVGNKIDLERSRAVNKDEVEEYARSIGAKCYLTSAKLNQGLDELFLDMTKTMVAMNPAPVSSSSGGRGNGTVTLGEPDTRRRGGNDVLADFENEQTKTTGGGGCCG
eukprot:TRINITY_DN21857_c0_g1_i1.p1 TRINITY_DN21857_c0_g1~~TRINITY_DN21857_c0_g1_i1.p1  ORF type:complete len:219 (-),score=45.96 TRINITY_DN21857_c0_g1_i1:64-720(-)